MRRGVAVCVLAVATAGALAGGGVRAEGTPPVVEAYRRLLLEPTEEHLLDAAIAAHMNAPDLWTVEFLRRHLRNTEGTVLSIDGVEYSDAEVAYQCLDGCVLDTTEIAGGRVKGIVSRWVEDCPFRLHLVEMPADNAARCDALARAWLEGYRTGRAGKVRPDEAAEWTNWLRGYYAGKAARKLAGE